MKLANDKFEVYRKRWLFRCWVAELWSATPQVVVGISCGFKSWLAHYVDSEGNEMSLWKKNPMRATEHKDVTAVSQRFCPANCWQIIKCSGEVSIYVCPPCLKLFPKSPPGQLQRQETAGGDLTRYSDSSFLMFWYSWSPTIKMLSEMLCKDAHCKAFHSKDRKVCIFWPTKFA